MEQNLSVDQSTLSKDTFSKTATLAWAIFFTGILYYCFAYLLRVYPSVMEPQLLHHFHITAGSFGVLTSFYYFAYAPMQLPVGVSVDKIGPRRSMMIACTISITGALLFSQSDLYTIALVGRFLIGFGSAFAYVTALKLATIWLPRRFFATATGAVTGMGMISAIFTDIYLTHIVETNGYQHAMKFPLFIGLILFVLIIAIIRDKPKDKMENEDSMKRVRETSALSFHELKEFLLTIMKNPQMWIIGAVGALLYLPASVFLDVWAMPYLQFVYHLTPDDAAVGISIMLAGWICSSFMTGALSDILGRRRTPLLIGTFGAATTAAFIVYVPNIPQAALYILLFILGAFCGPHPLCFTLSKENYMQKISGTAIAFANFIIMMGGFIFQPVVGKLLDLVWVGTIQDGIRVYTPSNYMFALSIMPLGLLIAGVLSLFIKETYHKAVDRHS
ncbi:MAG: MFS transporter [Coxiellaceae bacterium]|nr:MFS transporter [Coxiellaceae bacterium]